MIKDNINQLKEIKENRNSSVLGALEIREVSKAFRSCFRVTLLLLFLEISLRYISVARSYFL